MDYRNADPAKAFPMALEAMRNPGFLKTPKYQEQQTRANRVGAHPSIVEFSDKMVKRAVVLGIPLFPLWIVRTYEEQMNEFLQGDSKDDPSDGLWPHRFAAVDLIHGTLGYMDRPKIAHAWDIIGHLGFEVANSMQIKIKWGGHFKSIYDPAHFELEGWKKMPPPAGEGA